MTALSREDPQTSSDGGGDEGVTDMTSLQASVGNQLPHVFLSSSSSTPSENWNETVLDKTMSESSVSATKVRKQSRLQTSGVFLIEMAFY